MNTVKTWQTVSSDSDATYEIGERLGRACKGGEVFLLLSDLGGGKTTLVKGLAKGLGSNDHVVSPTFTISRVYKCRDHLSLHHFDFYRLQNAGVVAHELAEVVDDSHIIVAIEWGDIVKSSLPSRRVEIEIKTIDSYNNKRKIVITLPAGYEYLLREIV